MFHSAVTAAVIPASKDLYGGGSSRTSERGDVDYQEVLDRINELAREEHELCDRESHGIVTDCRGLHGVSRPVR